MGWVDKMRKDRERVGQKKYGLIHPKTDPRSFIKECQDELLDALNYIHWASEKGEISLRECRVIDRSIRLTLILLEGWAGAQKGDEDAFKKDA